MAETIDLIFQEAMTLPNSVRMELVERLISTIDDDPEIESEQIQEVQRRMAQVDSGAIETIPGEKVFQEIRESLAARRRP